jgi:NitT/TauT family transport system substrate-binding protein
MDTVKENMVKKIRPSQTALAVACIVLLSGSASPAQTRIKLSLDSKIDGLAAPFVTAIDKGYFKAEGLDVTIQPATSRAEPISRVASGGYDMGFADINALIRFRDANPSGAPKAVFMVYNKPAFAIISRKSRGVNKPKDLEGKTLGAPAADLAYAQWKIFAKANDIDTAKVKIENIGIPVRDPMLQNGQVDAITGLSSSSFINLKSMGVPIDDIVVMPMADYGVELYGNAIIVSPKLTAENPDAVNGFLRAFLKGLKDTVKNPAAAVDLVLKRNDEARKSVELERLRAAIRENIVTPEVKANGYGGIDEARFAKSIDQIALAYDFKRDKAKAAEAFDASFLPPAAERKAN